jgi:hypothetical protein
MSLDPGLGRAYDFATMAKSGDSDGGSAGGWPGLLSELTKSFLILRDIFGYALPGAVFLATGVLCHRLSLDELQSFLKPYHLPVWLVLVLMLGACYTVGHLMAQVAYLPSNWKTWRKMAKAKADAKTEHSAKDEAKVAEKTEHMGLDPVLIELRESHPELLTELERQSTVSQFRGGAGAAMLLGCVIFYVIPITLPIGLLLGIAGTFQLLVFWLSGIPHIDDLKCDTIQAGKNAMERDKTPPPGGKTAGGH